MDNRKIPYRVDRIALVYGAPSPVRPYFLARYARSYGGEWRLDSGAKELAATSFANAQVEAAKLLSRSGPWSYVDREKGLRAGYWAEVGPGE